MSGRTTDLTDVLRASGLNAKPTGEGGGAWIVSIKFGDQPFMVIVANGQEYIMILCPYMGHVFRRQHLADVDPESLRNIVRLNSYNPLAKVEFIDYADTGTEGGGASPASVLMVTSQCSNEGVTGDKLRRRVMACADVAYKALEFFPPSSDAKAP